MSLNRDDEDWLRHNGIAPHDPTVLAKHVEAAMKLSPAFADVMHRLVEALAAAVPALDAATDAIITYEIDEFCEAATLLDPGVPVSGDQEGTSG